MARLPLIFSFQFLIFNLAASAANPILLGIDTLERGGFQELRGKRVGLFTHAAGVNRFGTSSAEVLKRAPQVNLVALFGPEHGIYGDAAANEKVSDAIDPRTNLPVFSLYGATRRPTPEMLARIDVMVIDLQDIGTRSYTYTSSMRYAMEACFQHDVEVIVLDRPNPLGGLKVDGPPLDKQWMSFVGAFQVPYIHGLTIGELALISKRTPGWLHIPENTRQKGKLTVIPMTGWRRSMMWPETGLKWTATSPNIPDLSSVLGYPITGLGQQHSGFSHGIGTPYPFRLLRHPGMSPASLLRALQDLHLPGFDYKVIQTKTNRGQAISGVYVLVTDWRVCSPTALSFHMMQLGAQWSNGNPYATLTEAEMVLFNKHVGSTAWWDEISRLGGQARVDFFNGQWATQAREFKAWCRQFWLYQ